MKNVSQSFDLHLESFGQTRSCFLQTMPIECANELQYMLNHLMKVKHGDEKYNADCVQRATGHLRRAHLDYLKTATYTLQSYITTCVQEHIPGFLQSLLVARFLEFKNIGCLQDAAIAGYRNTLNEFRTKAQLETLLQPSSAGAQQHIPYGSGIANDETVWLYNKWAKLELLLTSVANDRIYDPIHEIIDAFFTGFLHEALPYIITSTKSKILQQAQDGGSAMKKAFAEAFSGKSEILLRYLSSEAKANLIGKIIDAGHGHEISQDEKDEARAEFVQATSEAFHVFMQHFYPDYDEA